MSTTVSVWLHQHWVTVLVTVLSFLLIGLLVWWLWKRYSKLVKAWWLDFTRKPEIDPNALILIWQEFWHSLPRTLRSNARKYPVYVVMGDHGSGKTTLIKQRKFIEAQPYRGHGSSERDPLMQVFLSNDAIIIELSARFLYATTPDYSDALITFWRELPVNARMVLVANIKSLLTDVEDNQARVFDALVGKLALLSELNEVRISFAFVLTHMDSLQGYTAFQRYAARVSLDVQVRLDPAEPVPQFSHGLSYYKEYLEHVLVNSSAQDFLDIVSLFNQSSSVLQQAYELLNTACRHYEFESVALDRVCLQSSEVDAHEAGQRGSDPFWYQTTGITRRDIYSSRHIRRAAVIAGLIVPLQVSSYWFEKQNIDQVVDMLNAMPSIKKYEYAHTVHPQIQRLGARLLPKPKIHRLPEVTLGMFVYDFFDDMDRKLMPAIMRSIRSNYILPRLSQVQNEENTYQKIIRILALLHANDDNAMGVYFQDPNVQDGLAIPYEIIDDYLLFNTNPEDPQLQKLKDIDYVNYEGNLGYGQILHSSESPWRRFADNLNSAMQQPYLTPGILDGLQKTARNVFEISRRILHVPNLDAQREWLENHGYISLRTRLEWQKYPTQAQLESPALHEAAKLVMDGSIANPAVPANIYDLLVEIQKINDAFKKSIESNKIGIVTARFSERGYQFDTDLWLQLIYRSTIHAILQTFSARNPSRDGWGFFDPSIRVSKRPLGISTDSSGSLANKAQIDTRLTHTAFEVNVKPSLNLLPAMLESLNTNPADRERIESIVIDNANSYASNYANAYWSALKAMNVHISSRDQLLMYLREVHQSGSAFTQNMLRVKENVSMELPSGLYFQPMRDRLLDFGFLEALMQGQAGIFPQLQRYFAILAGLSDKLNVQSEPTPEKSEKTLINTNGLLRLMSPMGRQAFEMFQGVDGNPIAMTRAWLQEMMIPEVLAPVFMEPVLKTRDYGLIDINSAIAGSWEKIWTIHIQPMLGLFPFDRSRPDVDVSPDQLIAQIHPATGSFWQALRSTFGFVLLVNENQWMFQPGLSDSLQFPDSMLSRINAVAALTATLWNKNLQPESGKLWAQPGFLPPLPDVEKDPESPVAQLLFLRCGSSSVLGFNQQSQWQEIGIDWWQKGAATVGLEFQESGQQNKQYGSVDIDRQNWPLLRLLSRANKTRGLEYTWSIVLPRHPERSYPVTIRFRTDPFEPFAQLSGR